MSQSITRAKSHIMNNAHSFKNSFPAAAGGKLWMFAALALCSLVAECCGQGTMTFNFEGQPRGTRSQLGAYTESGMAFAPPVGPGSLYHEGGGITGYPDNGTGYLDFPDGNLTAAFVSFPPTVYFNLVSFDAAEYGSSVTPVTLTVIGYRPMASPVTNYFTLDGVNDGTGPLQDFQTFYLDSSFVNLSRFDVVHAFFSLDNVVISGVPEPTAGALMLLAGLCAAGYTLIRRS